MTTTPIAEPDSDVEPLRAGKAPVGTGAAPLFAQLVALALIALGVVAVQNLLVVLGTVKGESWTSQALEAADGLTGDSAIVLVVGIVVAVLGLALLPVALRRRPRKGLELRAETGVHLRPRDLGRVAEAALDDAEAVTGVDVKVTRRRLRVTARTVAGRERDEEISSDLAARLDPVLAALQRPPRVRVTIRHEQI